MPKFSKEIQKFFLAEQDLTDNPHKQLRKILEPIPRSCFHFNPGDLLVFVYKKEIRVALVVSTKRGNGKFISTRNNILIPCFQLDKSSSILPIIRKNLYKRREKADYQFIKKSLGVLLGIKNFRTYNLQNMHQIHLVNL